MKRLLCLLVVGVMSAPAADVGVSTRDATQEVLVGRRVTLLPEYRDGTVGTSLLEVGAVTRITDTNGNAFFTNVVAGKYQLAIAGVPGTVYKLLVPTNQTFYWAVALKRTTNAPAADPQYVTTETGDARYALRGESGGGANALTNNAESATIGRVTFEGDGRAVSSAANWALGPTGLAEVTGVMVNGADTGLWFQDTGFEVGSGGTFTYPQVTMSSNLVVRGTIYGNGAGLTNVAAAGTLTNGVGGATVGGLNLTNGGVTASHWSITPGGAIDADGALTLNGPRGSVGLDPVSGILETITINSYGPLRFDDGAFTTDGNGSLTVSSVNAGSATIGTLTGNGAGLTNVTASALSGARQIATNAPPFDGLLAWYSGSAQSGTNGQVLATVIDSSGNGNHGTSTSGPKLWAKAFGSRSAMRFRGYGIAASAENNFITIPQSVAVNQTNGFSVFFVSRLMMPIKGCFLSLNTNLGYTGNFQYRHELPQINRFYCVGNGQGNYGGSGFMPGGISVHGFTVQTNDQAAGQCRIKYWMNGNFAGTSAMGLTAIGSYTGGYIGKNGVSQYEFSGDVFEALIYNRTLSADEVEIITKWAALNYTFGRDARTLVVCVGDSITGGGGSGQNGNFVDKTYPAQLAERLGGGFRIFNYGYSGYKIGTILSTFFPTISDTVAATTGFAEKWIVLQGGVNDLIAGTNGAVNYTNFVTLAKAAKATGAKVAVLTSVAPSSTQTETDAYNNALRAYLRPEAAVDAIFDVAADTRFGAGKANYIQADGVHPTEAGAGVLAELVAQNLMSYPAANVWFGVALPQLKEIPTNSIPSWGSTASTTNWFLLDLNGVPTLVATNASGGWYTKALWP